MTEMTRVSTDIDYDKNGKQHGHLSVPNSRDNSGWGTLLMPITVIKNGEGPTLLLSGGNHGDEYEGPVALMKLIRALDPSEIKGKIIVIPGLNYPAFLAGKRLSPIDGKNMNRIFPGKYDGTISEVIAHYVYHYVLPQIDACYDLHSGGYSMFMVPSAMCHYLEDKDLMARHIEALKAFRAPMMLIAEELDVAGMLDTAVEEMGKVFIGTELGGGAILTPESVKVAETGIRNVLKHFGMMEGEPVTPTWRGQTEAKLYEIPDLGYFCQAKADGLYEPFYEIGDWVEEGAPVGQIHFPQSPEHDAMVVAPKKGGRIWCRRAPGMVEKGDAVAVLAIESEK
ncbi:MAG: N-alpha-acetyl diaminobutyric acid deacetylase DoeB [Rhodospirillaceae bacterium]|jgi:N2-acetyl-L-2,4-diaminobutanoate deacetylase|nr:N-alpha-acetyl diaminobutyric acid deacetylase DoeB [Rhodospirillaceae bacterium]MBT6119781.1 N-alpha-acetyl diaminobutyric acid deacetylase DoeB [Rhodospirillaceae bacterium]